MMEKNKAYQISISSKAAEQVIQQLEKRGTPNAYLRLGVKGGGCSGYEYVLQFEDKPPQDKDIIFNIEGVQIIVDKKSILYLNGTTLDWEQSLIKRGFKFINPNEKSSCGCGASFNF